MTFEYQKPWRPVRHKGVRYRSVLEAQWAETFARLGIEAKYEPETFDVVGGKYTPDFFIPHLGYIEIKPYRGEGPNTGVVASPEVKLALLSEALREKKGIESDKGSWCILLMGNPRQHESWIVIGHRETDAGELNPWYAFYGNRFFSEQGRIWWGRSVPGRATEIGQCASDEAYDLASRSAMSIEFETA